jgi:hypothetical protein
VEYDEVFAGDIVSFELVEGERTGIHQVKTENTLVSTNLPQKHKNLKKKYGR